MFVINYFMIINLFYYYLFGNKNDAKSRALGQGITLNYSIINSITRNEITNIFVKNATKQMIKRNYVYIKIN